MVQWALTISVSSDAVLTVIFHVNNTRGEQQQKGLYKQCVIHTEQIRIIFYMAS